MFQPMQQRMIMILNRYQTFKVAIQFLGSDSNIRYFFRIFQKYRLLSLAFTHLFGIFTQVMKYFLKEQSKVLV